MRVVNRVKEGGHYVEPNHIAANFYGNLEKLDIYFKIFDTIQIIDTSETEPKVLCLIQNNCINSCIPLDDLPEWFVEYLPNIYNKAVEFLKQ